MNATPDLDSHARDLDARLRAAVRRKRRADHELATLLLEMKTSKAHQRLGYPTVRAYAEHELGLSPRTCQALLAVATRAQASEPLREAVDSGALSYTKARELLRVATDDTLPAWIDTALGSTNRELEQRVAASQPGEPPPEAPADHLEPARHTLVIRDVETSDWQAIQDYLAAVRNQAQLGPGELDRGLALADLCREGLRNLQAEPDGPNADRHLIVLHHNADTGEITGEGARVSEAVAAQARCDHVTVDLGQGPNRGRARASIPPSTRRATLHRFHRCCAVPGCTHRLYLELHHVDPLHQGGDDDERGLVPLCSQHHRLLHDGHLGIEVLADGTLRFTRRDGRVVLRAPTPLDPAPDGRPRGRCCAAPVGPSAMPAMDRAPPATGSHGPPTPATTSSPT